MEFDPFHISTLKNRIASDEKAIAVLHEDISRKDEERARMEAQIITLSESIASKDHTIYDLEQKVKILQQSVDELADSAREKCESKRMAEFYKQELGQREQEVAMLTRERDMLNWKLIHEAMPTEDEVKQERNSLRVKNDKLTYENSGLQNKLENLSRKIDILARRNADLTTELEKRSRFSDRLKSDFESAIQSRNKIRTEVDNLKKKLMEVQNSMKSSSTIGTRRIIQAKSSERPSLLPKRSTTQNSLRSQRSTPPSKETSALKTIINTTQGSMDAVVETPRTESSIFNDVEKSMVRKIVHNIQSSFSASPGTTSNTKSFILVEQPEDPSLPVHDTSDDFARKLAFDNIRDILENKFSFESQDQANQMEQSYHKARSIQSNASLLNKEHKNHRL